MDMIRDILHWLLPDPRIADLRRALHNKSLTLSLLEGEADDLRRQVEQLTAERDSLRSEAGR